MADLAYTTGAKRVLFIPCIFADEISTPVVRAVLDRTAAALTAYCAQCSRGKLTLTVTITDPIQLPEPAAFYALFSKVLGGGLTAAKAADPSWSYPTHDHFIVFTTNKAGKFPWAGRSYQGNAGAHIVAGYAGLRTVGHEFFHNLGLEHSTCWRSASASPTGEDGPGGVVADVPGTSLGEVVKYGHSFSIMGGQIGPPYDDPTKPHLSPIELAQLGWIAPGDGLQEVTKTGLYRVYALENPASPVVGLKVMRQTFDYTGGPHLFWLCLRTKFSAKSSQGVQFDWSASGAAGGAIQLDMTPQSMPDTAVVRPGVENAWAIGNADKEDGVLVPGAVIFDESAKLRFTTKKVDLAAPIPYADIQIDFDALSAEAPDQVPDPIRLTGVPVTRTTIIQKVVPVSTSIYNYDFAFNLAAYAGRLAKVELTVNVPLKEIETSSVPLIGKGTVCVALLDTTNLTPKFTLTLKVRKLPQASLLLQFSS